MKRLIGLAIVAGVVGSVSPASAQAAWTFNPISGPMNSLRGFLLDSPGGTDQYNTPYGYLFTLAAAPMWGLGMNKIPTSNTASYDFFLRSYTGTSPVGQVLNVRSDNGQMSIGPNISTNTGVRQVQVTAGTPTTPLAGLAVTTYGAQTGLALQQSATPPVGGTANKRVQINLNDIYQVGTDAWSNSGTNYYVADTSLGSTMWRYPFTITSMGNQTDAVVLGMNANDQIGFYGSAGISKPVITGCRSDGTAVANLLQKLQAMGVITDQTTP